MKDALEEELPSALLGRTTLPADSAARKEIPLYRGLLRYFPAALAGVANLSKLGNDKHNPGEEMHHARGKSTDQADCILRHMMDMSEDFGRGVGRDENGVPQVVMAAWRALALAQEWLEANDGAPLAPGARLPEVKAEAPGPPMAAAETPPAPWHRISRELMHPWDHRFWELFEHPNGAEVLRHADGSWWNTSYKPGSAQRAVSMEAAMLEASAAASALP